MKRLLKRWFGRTKSEEEELSELKNEVESIDSEWDEAYPQSRPGVKHRSKYRQGGPLRSERKKKV